jgi:hypothetical protein
MSVSVQALLKGGFSTFGQSSYDSRANVIVVKAADGEIVNITVSFPDSISTINYDADGIETTEPTISSATFTAELSNFAAGDRIKYEVLLSTGEQRDVNFEIAGAAVRSIIGRSGDYGDFA